MDIYSSAYLKATSLLTSASLAELDHEADPKRQRLNYTFPDSASLIAGKSISLFRT